MNSHEAKHRQQVVEWKERVLACRSSGMSVKAWCQQAGYSAKTYYRWEREAIEVVWESIQAENAIACTACRYCVKARTVEWCTKEGFYAAINL